MNLPTMFALIALGVTAEPEAVVVGEVGQPAFILDKELRGPFRPYVPQAGDIIVESDDRLTWKWGHNLAKTGHPHHSAVVFQRADGTFATLQAGGHDKEPSKVGITDLREHLQTEAAKTGRRERRVWIRQRKEPLSAEQSAALTQYAMEVERRRFARGRLFLMMTPWRAKGPIRTAWLGKPDLDRGNFYCSEMVATALVAAGALDADLARPGAMFPRDLFFGTCRNYFVERGLKPLNQCWHAPARWLPGCDVCPDGKRPE